MITRLLLFGTYLLALANLSQAANIGVVGLFPGKAVLVVDASAPKTYSVGSIVAAGIQLVSVNQSTATIAVNGKRQIIAIGEYINRIAPTGPATVILQADSRGHFVTLGQINGGTVRMLVDTGATMVALSAADALRLGIDYKKGKTGLVNTANGLVSVYRVQLNTVRIGDIELNQVEAVVQESGLPLTLLGMSFLNRTEMRREGEQMTLTKRF